MKLVVVGITGNLAPKVKIGQEIVRTDSRYFRPSEVETLLEIHREQKRLGLGTKITIKEMCKEMVKEDHKAARFALLKAHDLELPLQLRIKF